MIIRFQPVLNTLPFVIDESSQGGGTVCIGIVDQGCGGGHTTHADDNNHGPFDSRSHSTERLLIRTSIGVRWRR